MAEAASSFTAKTPVYLNPTYGYTEVRTPGIAELRQHADTDVRNAGDTEVRLGGSTALRHYGITALRTTVISKGLATHSPTGRKIDSFMGYAD